MYKFSKLSFFNTLLYQIKRYSGMTILDDPERHDLKSRFLLFFLLFFFPLFLGGKRKGDKNNQSRNFKSCFSGSSHFVIFLRVVQDRESFLSLKQTFLEQNLGKISSTALVINTYYVAILLSPSEVLKKFTSISHQVLYLVSIKTVLVHLIYKPFHATQNLSISTYF